MIWINFLAQSNIEKQLFENFTVNDFIALILWKVRNILRASTMSDPAEFPISNSCENNNPANESEQSQPQGIKEN